LDRLLGYPMAHRAIESLTRREQRFHTSRRWIGAVFAAGTDRISSEADNHCTEQNSSNDIIVFHGGEGQRQPAQRSVQLSPLVTALDVVQHNYLRKL
jgi:hypothetical protein